MKISTVWKNRGRHTCFAAGAARQAVDSSGVLDSHLDPERFGVYLGSGEGSQDFFSFADMMAVALAEGQFDLERFIKRGLEMLNPAAELEQEPNMPAGHMAAMFDARGPEFQLPDRLRGQQSGGGGSHRDHSTRRCRRHALRAEHTA